MKISVVKMVLLVPFLLFLDWVILAITGSLSSLLGADDQFYCTIYCYFGIIMLITTFLIIAYILVRPYLHLHRRVHV